MGKTAPDTYQPIPDGHVYPLEPVTEGNASSRRGMYEQAVNVNHLIRRLRPTWVLQANRILVSQQSTPGNMTLRHVWRGPLWTANAATSQLDVWVFAECEAGTTGTIRVATSIDTLDFAVVNTGDYALYSGQVDFDPAVAETISLSMQRTGGAGEMAMCSVSIAPHDGDNPAIGGGQDIEAVADQEPTTVHLYRRLVDQLDTLLAARRGHMLSYSVDVARVTAEFSTSSSLYVLRGAPVRVGPKYNRIMVWANGYYTGTSGDVKVWVQSLGSAGALTLSLPAAGAFDASTSWVSGYLTVPTELRIHTETLAVQLIETGAGTAYLSGLCAWEARQ